jgi:hypothetical protein
VGEQKSDQLQHEHFYTILKETYEKGLNDRSMTVKKLLDGLIIDLKKHSS